MNRVTSRHSRLNLKENCTATLSANQSNIFNHLFFLLPECRLHLISDVVVTLCIALTIQNHRVALFDAEHAACYIYYYVVDLPCRTARIGTHIAVTFTTPQVTHLVVLLESEHTLLLHLQLLK